MHLDWIKNSQTGSWYDLLKLNLDSPYFNNLYGIYAIWYTTPSGGKIIKIGTGYIGERLKAEKANSDIVKYAQVGQLKVTWAVGILPNQIGGVVAFLSDAYNPILGENATPGITKVQVNLIGD